MRYKIVVDIFSRLWAVSLVSCHSASIYHLGGAQDQHKVQSVSLTLATEVQRNHAVMHKHRVLTQENIQYLWSKIPTDLMYSSGLHILQEGYAINNRYFHGWNIVHMATFATTKEAVIDTIVSWGSCTCHR